MHGVQSPLHGWNSVYKNIECCNNAIYNLRGLTVRIGTYHHFDGIVHNLVHTNEVPTLVILEKQEWASP